MTVWQMLYCLFLYLNTGNSQLLVIQPSYCYNIVTVNKGGKHMETKDIILELRIVS